MPTKKPPTDDALEQWERETNAEVERDSLHFAAGEGDLQAVVRLVAEGYPLNRFDDVGHTPLHYAAATGNLEVMRALIDAGANVNARDERTAGDTPLGHVAGHCSLAVARLLVESGADPSIPGTMGITPLHLAKGREDLRQRA